MVAAIQISSSLPYAGNYQSFGVPVLQQPSEGNRTVPVSVVWASDAIAPDYAISFDLRMQRNLQINQICSLYVDNLGNDADVSFYFPDTQFRLDVPAYSSGVFPVITNSLQFVGFCPTASDGDRTFIQIMNFYPPPIAVEKTIEQSPATTSHLTIPAGSSSDTMIYTGPGNLLAYSVSVQGLVGSGQLQVALEDGVGGTFLMDRWLTVTATEADTVVGELSGLNVPFVNGVNLHLSDTGVTGGGVTVVVYVAAKGD